MKLLLTGASGSVGSHTLKYLLARSHDITAVDIVAIPIPTLSSTSATDRPPGQLTTVTCDLADWKAVEELFASQTVPFDGVIHFGAIPNPLYHDPRIVHNVNVTSSYNVLQTAASHGVKRIVQASSVNAIGLSYTPEGHKRVDTFPITEEEPITAEDAYAISKAACELQASALCRFYPDLRIASLRFHMCKPNYAESIAHSRVQDLFAWTSMASCASAALLSITSEGWHGHEVFNITAPEIVFQGLPDDMTAGPSALEAIETHWGGKYRVINKEWWADHPRRSVFDSTKAEKMLGWDHDKADEQCW
ncbi:hypothetical protein BD324DRAFT_638536 [Kockovaella imperatae]|uniref:NAD-dependent epimerase/dehydratase domain-containing protein n=1 Tax=Kockovaella imperatae TaxID=4999 RepID=A0A1Y1U9K3_9TREE|nr:hypothetical protein BD324DRAFT_638536 [Kockovaella imperatae]ORX33775.1 hypothetical protein BD324DRAFT_638536 [Kockovaella imperatae]